MCGIAGFVTQQGQRPDALVLKRMCDRLAHRGPDGYGEWLDDRAALGHRRLSIIDVAGGAQPMGNEDNSLQVIFNGEIYNYLELRADLIQRGHRFQTNSDTEVLVHLYEEEGERMPERLNGMFALAIWDTRNGELFLARDRFGKKPLYFTHGAPGIRVAFASELKALLELPGFDRRVDSRSVADFLALSYVPEPRSIFRGIERLEPGSSLLVRASGESKRRYWRLEFGNFVEPGPANLNSVIEELDTLSADAVKRRLLSDVPLGAFLSGGVDSSAIVAYMAEAAPDRVKTFSIGFTEREFDETSHARRIVDRYRTDHYEKTVTPRIEETLDVLVNHFDEPFGDSSAIPTLYLSRMTRERVTVALAGDGADEMFGGYRRYRFGAWEQRLREKFPGWFRHSVIRAAGQIYPKFDYLPRVFRAKTLLSNLALELGDAYFTSMSVFRDAELARVLAPELRAELGGYDPRTWYRELFQRHAHLPPLQQMQAVDLETYLPGDILVKADRATMAYSLEGRAPWLDYRIGELSARLPADWKIHGREGKWIFKKMLEPRVPHENLYRPKMGFSVPLAEWFRTSLRGVFEDKVLNSANGDWIDIGEARRLWNQHQSGTRNRDRWLWNLLMLSLWRERFAQ